MKASLRSMREFAWPSGEVKFALNTSATLPYSQAAGHLLDEFAWNPWFLDSYWPENEPRVRFIARLAQDHSPVSVPRRLLDVGCGNGYIAYLFSLLGFEASTVDAYEDQKRDALFRRQGISHTTLNLNDESPLGEIPADSFDVVLLGEVFEHILNNPAGLLQAIYRVLRPGGLLILTTPNPSTIANATRLLRDGYVLWGTPEFLRTIKLESGKVIDRGDIHYHEYPAWIVRDLAIELGYRVESITYVRAGISTSHSLEKRWLKRLLWWSGLSGIRLFAPGYVLCARKPA